MDNPYYASSGAYARGIPGTEPNGGFKNQTLEVQTPHARSCDIHITSRYCLGQKDHKRYEVRIDLGGASHEFVAKMIAFCKGEQLHAAAKLQPRPALPPKPVEVSFDDEPPSK